jgi:adenine-specific DNA-methyltransferase
MYSRLKLARNLLSDDGSIFISIDDNEVYNLRKISDEVFGERNFACSFIVKSNPRGSQSTSFCSSVHESILCYVKDNISHPGFTLPLTKEMIAEYKFTDGDKKYRLLGLRLRGGAWRREQRPKLFYPIFVDPETGKTSLEKTNQFCKKVLPIKPSTGEDGTWRWSKEKLQSDNDAIIAKEVQREGETIWDIFQKDFLDSEGGQQKETKPKTIWDEKEMNYQNGTVLMKDLFEKSPFDFPKPIEMMKKIVGMATENNDIIFDFFCGSSTTAHAVLEQNIEDGGARKFIMAQLPESCAPKTDAFKAGYKNIAEISKERIRRAGKKIKKEKGVTATDLDIGFRVLKIDSSNMADIYYRPDKFTQDMVAQMQGNIKTDRSPEDLLFQVLLDWGVDLTLPVARETIEGNEVFFVDGNALAACLSKTGEVTEDFCKELAKRGPLRVVFRDAGFKDDSVKINIEQIFKLMSPHTEVKTI